MDLTTAFAADYLVWDNVETATHQAGRLGGGGTTTALTVAKRRALTYKELAISGGAYTGLDKVWLVPAAVLSAGFKIIPGDTITDTSSVAWTVLESTLGKFSQTHRCICRDLVLVNALTYLIDIERAGLQQDAAGGVVRVWPGHGGNIAYEQIRASVQPLEADPMQERGMLAGQATYQVVVDRQLTLMLDRDRIKWTGIDSVVRYLDIVKMTNPSRIDQLPMLTCELRP